LTSARKASAFGSPMVGFHTVSLRNSFAFGSAARVARKAWSM
jgi:hypothetical protein